MTTLGRALLYGSVAVIAIFTGFKLQNTQITNTLNHVTKNTPVTDKGANLILTTTLPDLQGENQSILQWKGKVLIVNFWATWCEPCRREMPEFIKLQDELYDKGLLFIGIALDKKNKVKQYSEEIGVNYPILLGGIEAMELAEAAGNRYAVLPFTVIFNRNGEIISTHTGRIAREELEPILKPLL